MHVSRLIDLPDERASFVSRLSTLEDVEVVVGSVSTAVSLGTHSRTKDDQVLGDTGVDDEHAAHSASGVVEHPFGWVLEILGKERLRVVLDQLVDERRDEQGGVLRGAGVGRSGNVEGFEDRRVQHRRLEDVEPVLQGVRLSCCRVGKTTHIDLVEPGASDSDESEDDGPESPSRDPRLLRRGTVLCRSHEGWEGGERGERYDKGFLVFTLYP